MKLNFQQVIDKFYLEKILKMSFWKILTLWIIYMMLALHFSEFSFRVFGCSTPHAGNVEEEKVLCTPMHEQLLQWTTKFWKMEKLEQETRKAWVPELMGWRRCSLRRRRCTHACWSLKGCRMMARGTIRWLKSRCWMG